MNHRQRKEGAAHESERGERDGSNALGRGVAQGGNEGPQAIGRDERGPQSRDRQRPLSDWRRRPAEHFECAPGCRKPQGDQNQRPDLSYLRHVTGERRKQRQCTYDREQSEKTERRESLRHRIARGVAGSEVGEDRHNRNCQQEREERETDADSRCAAGCRFAPRHGARPPVPFGRSLEHLLFKILSGAVNEYLLKSLTSRSKKRASGIG